MQAKAVEYEEVLDSVFVHIGLVGIQWGSFPGRIAAPRWAALRDGEG